VSTLCRRRKTLEELASKSADELAPSLGSVISAIIAGSKSSSRPEIFADPIHFIRITYPTETLKSVIRDVTGTIISGGTKVLFLNLDMGSGKTHLLTSLYHLFYTLPRFYSNDPTVREISDKLSNFDPDYDFMGNGRNSVAVFPLDFRAKNFREQVSAWTESLKRVGDWAVAKELENYLDKGCTDSTIFNCLPNALDFAEKINNRISIIWLIDEFYYGVREAAQGSISAELITRLLDFIRTFIDRRRAIATSYRSAIIALIAGARSDYEWWQSNRSQVDKALVDKVKFFEDQISRVISQVETKWLNIDDAMNVICTRLGLNEYDCNNAFHDNFRDFVGRVIKADTDFPDAQHLRGLIKASAIFALNACDLGDSKISPVHFNEGVIDALVLSPLLATMYKSNYNYIIGYIEKSVSNDVEKSILRYMVNDVFAGSIVGDVRKLIFALRGSKEIVLSTEGWIRKSIEPILEEKKYPNNILTNAILKLSNLPYVREVSVSNEVAYVVSPYINPKTLLYELIEEHRKKYYINGVDKVSVVKSELSRIIPSINNAPGWAKFLTTDKLSELCKEGRLTDSQDKLFVVITFSDGEHEIEDGIKCLVSKGVIMPVVVKFNLNDDAYSHFVDYISRYEALLDLKAILDDKYLREVGRNLVQRAGAQSDKELEQRLIEEVKKDYVNMANDEMKAALNKLMNGIAIMLDNIYYYNYVSMDGTVKEMRLVAGQLLNNVQSIRAWSYEGIKEELNKSITSSLDNLFTNYVQKIAEVVGYIFKYDDRIVKTYSDEVTKYVNESNEYQIPKDKPMVFIHDQQFIFYKPVYDKFLDELKKELQDKYGNGIEIEDKKENVIKFRIKKESEGDVGQEAPTTGDNISKDVVRQPQERSFDNITDFINSIRDPDNIAAIRFKIRINERSEAATVMMVLNTIKGLIEDADVELKDRNVISYRKLKST
jgi:hypothetical protein